MTFCNCIQPYNLHYIQITTISSSQNVSWYSSAVDMVSKFPAQEITDLLSITSFGNYKLSHKQNQRVFIILSFDLFHLA